MSIFLFLEQGTCSRVFNLRLSNLMTKCIIVVKKIMDFYVQILNLDFCMYYV